MKNYLMRLIDRLARNEISWLFLKHLSTFGYYLVQARLSMDREKTENRLHSSYISYQYLFQNLEVQDGPFKGMKYPQFDSVCSTVYPKLLGTYEKELWDTLDRLNEAEYTEILDIGCAEGYYAIGLGIIHPKSKIYAYDTSDKARKLCKEMAALNNIPDRVIIKAECTADELKTFPFTGKGLIISDCEGFEKELFNENNISNLATCDLIIETHDFIDISISTYLKQLLDKSHNIYSIKSTDDIQKALTYNVKGLEEFTFSDKKHLLAERRPAIMEWIICRSII
jgi:SAM-dependent methyltransferase